MASNPAKKRGSGGIESFMLSTTAYARLKRHLAGREAATNENDLVHFAKVDNPTGAGGWDHTWEHASRGCRGEAYLIGMASPRLLSEVQERFEPSSQATAHGLASSQSIVREFRAVDTTICPHYRVVET